MNKVILLIFAIICVSNVSAQQIKKVYPKIDSVANGRVFYSNGRTSSVLNVDRNLWVNTPEIGDEFYTEYLAINQGKYMRRSSKGLGASLIGMGIASIGGILIALENGSSDGIPIGEVLLIGGGTLVAIGTLTFAINFGKAAKSSPGGRKLRYESKNN